MGYTCTDNTTDNGSGGLDGEKWCECFGGRYSTDCNNMLKRDKCKNLDEGGNHDLVCTSTSCVCTMAKTTFKPPQIEIPPTQGLAPVQPPTKRRFRFNRSRFKGVMSRGIDQLPPAVSPDPEPPALPNFELQGEKP